MLQAITKGVTEMNRGDIKSFKCWYGYLHFHVIRNIFFFLDKAYCWEASEFCLMSVDYVICNDFGISFIEIYASLMATIKNNKLACME